MSDQSDGRASESEGAPQAESARAWLAFGQLPLDGHVRGSEGDPALQAQLADLARKQRDPEWRASFEARMAPWLASMARGEPAAALVASSLPHGADALVIRDPAAVEPRLVVLSELACSFAHITRGRHGLRSSEMRTLNVPSRVEIALWLDGRVRLEDADGRAREWTEPWRYVGGEQPERERKFLSRFRDAPYIELRGLGPARLAPSYLYPRTA